MHEFTEETAALAAAVFDYSLERIRMDPPPLDHHASADELDERAGQTITEGGLGALEALRLWIDVLGPACVSVDFPRHLSFVPVAPTDAATLFDLVVGASSIYGGSWLEASGAIHVENQALRWLADLAGLPRGAGGVFVSGGTAANLSALVSARHHAATRAGCRPAGGWAIATTEEAHSSILAAARVMDVDVVDVATDDDGRLAAPQLASTLDAEDGRIFAVVASAGTTNTGLIDDLASVGPLCRRRGVWLHVDAAYGGGALTSPAERTRFAGVELADSLAIDPHKWLFAPYDCAALLYRQPELARAAHTQHAGYLEPLNERGDWNPSDYAIHLSRRARGLPFWFSLAAHGTAAYRAAVEATLATAARAAELIATAPHTELACAPSLSVVVFRRLGWGPERYRAWSAAALEDGLAFVVPTIYRGETVLRMCFVNPRTTAADVDLILASLR